MPLRHLVGCSSFTGRLLVLFTAALAGFSGLAPAQVNDAPKYPPLVAQSLAVRPYAVKVKNGLTQGLTPTCSSNPKLVYYDGPIISNVQVVPVFWGSNVNAEVTSKMPQVYSDLTSSNWYDLLSEYASVGGTNQSIGRGTAAAGVTITPSLCGGTAACNLSDAQLQAEIVRQINAATLPTPQQDASGNINTVYMVHFPPNVTLLGPGGTASCVAGGFCAYHGTGTFGTGQIPLPYGAIMDTISGACSLGCGNDADGFNNQTSIASHELAEAVTDTDVGFATTIAAPLAWYDQNCGEIGDICTEDESTITVGGNSWTVQQLWSNANQACISTGLSPHYDVSAPSTATTGSAISFSVTTKNPAGSMGTDISYVGTVHFTSSDPTATLPADFIFAPSDQGTSTFSATLMASGTQTITATDTSNNNIVGTSSSISVSQSKQPNVITFTVNAPASAAFGTQFTVAATASSGLAVVFTSAGACSNIGSAYTMIASSGTCSVIANQSGNSNYVAAQAVTEYTTAVPATGSATITLTSSANPTVAGKSVTFTAKVAGTSVTPTGKVQFLNGATIVAAKTLSGGIASTSTKWLVPGSYTMTAVYSGDANYPGGTSAPLIQVVVTSTTTTLVSSLNPSTYNRPVTLTATVIAAAGSVPDGETVTFLHGSVVLGTGTLTGGLASFTTSALSAGTTGVTAKYAGDANYGASSSTTLKQVINPAATTTTLMSSLNPSRVKQAATFTVNVTGQYGGTPGGSVTIYDGASPLKTAMLSGGTVSVQISSLVSGTHNLQAVYKGTPSYGTSSSAVLVQTVQ